MQIFMIILGMIFILCALSCMITPLITVMEFGLYSAVHPVVLALTMGLMVGLYFIVSGINMIAFQKEKFQGGLIC